MQQACYSTKNKIIKTVKKQATQKITGRRKSEFSRVPPCDLAVSRLRQCVLQIEYLCLSRLQSEEGFNGF